MIDERAIQHAKRVTVNPKIIRVLGSMRTDRVLCTNRAVVPIPSGVAWM